MKLTYYRGTKWVIVPVFQLKIGKCTKSQAMHPPGKPTTFSCIFFYVCMTFKKTSDTKGLKPSFLFSFQNVESV